MTILSPNKMLVFMILVFVPLLSHAQGIQWNGYFQSDDRIHLGSKSYHFTWQEQRLQLGAEVKAGEHARFRTEIWLRSLGFAHPSNTSELQSIGTISPLDIQLREAYVELYGIPFSRIDMTIGRQRTPWGTGDRINPTDNIDPYDMEDIWEFGRHLSSDAFKLNYYLGDVTFSGIVVPFFKPAVLPLGNWKEALSPAMAPNSMIHIIDLSDTAKLPGLSPSQSMNAGLRVKGKAFGWDFSASYLYGRDGIPTVDSLTVSIAGQSYSEILQKFAATGALDAGVKAHLYYPRYQVAGFDAAGSIWDIGAWFEAALFFPEKVVMPETRLLDRIATPPANQTELMMQSLLQGISLPESTVLDNAPYFKCVAGFDYTFPANVYINLQYVHGFVHEKGKDLEDYLMGNLDWKLFNEKLKLTPIGVGLEIKDFKDIAENYAFVAQPAIAWYPVDNAEFILGARIITGKEDTYFGKVKDDDEMFVKLRYSF